MDVLLVLLAPSSGVSSRPILSTTRRSDRRSPSAPPPTTAESADDDDDVEGRKAFLSRVPQKFDEEIVKRILEERFGCGSVEEVCVVRSERSDEGGGGGGGKGGGADAEGGAEDGRRADEKKPNEKGGEHRGFGFATFASSSLRDAAIDAGTVRGSATPASKRKHTLYVRPVVRDDDEVRANADGNDANVCFLWKEGRCPYGEGCKFSHEGEGGCVTKDENKGDGGAPSAKKKKKRQKCFSFKKRGTCKLGAECPFSHDVAAKESESATIVPDGDGTSKDIGDKSRRDCVNWKNKGKCRKGTTCLYRHDPSVRERLLAKKLNKDTSIAEKKRKDQATKNRQSLSVRVFGLNYDTSEEEIRDFFSHCGPIVELTFPTFEDSGRSKGYCGVLFQSPKAVAAAVALDGKELGGRWLRVQEGKMFLRKWEEAKRARREGKEEELEKGRGAEPGVGEYGRRAKKRKRHGFKE
ncbi:hypothetical protein ACHAWF_015129 [Thalassiosira exigua]